MILHPLLLLLLLPTLALTLRVRPTPELLCYDSRYATRHPNLNSCGYLVTHSVAPNPIADTTFVFSRTPKRGEFGVPYTWKGVNCDVTIDIPDTPWTLPDERATLNDVRKVALNLVAACVAKSPNFGGVTYTGRLKNLQVTVEAGDEPKPVAEE
ncbi:MAG: hypothetical protein Q9185_001619 [Variospora sp. 1 TL-2023]